MAIPAFLIKAYFSAEDAYYKLADFLQKKLRVPVYKYYIEPIENTGTPSFPVTLALLAAILLLIGVAIVGAPRLAFQVTVMHGSIPVEGAQVALSGGNYYVELATDENGVALFEDLQDGAKLDLAVNKEGYKSKQATITIKKEGTTIKLFREGEAETTAGGEVSVSVVATNEAGAPIAGASVSYQFEEQANAGSTGAEGKYSFNAAQGATISVTVSKTGFETASDSFTASEGFSKTIILTPLSTDARLALRGTGMPVPRDGVNTEGSGDTEYSGLTVEVKGKNGANYTSAKVRVYNARNDAKISEATATPRQPAAFSRIAVGTEVYAIAEATGFASKKSNNTIVTRSQTKIVIEITALTGMTYNSTSGMWCSSNGTCVRRNETTHAYEDENGTALDNETLASLGASVDVYSVDNATGRGLGNGQVALQDAAGTPLYEARANAAGKASFADLPLGSTYTVFASKQDYFPYWSPAPFEAGSAPNYTARLVKGDANNSGTLEVHAYAIQGTAPINLANVDVSLRVDGKRWPESKKTSTAGIASFGPLPIGVTASANATIDEFTAENSTTIANGTNRIDLLALTPQYNLTIETRDYVRNTTMGASLKVYWPDARSEENLVANCTSTPSTNCRFTLYTKRDYTVKAEASGFATLSRPYVAGDASTREANLTIEMIPRTGNLVQYMGLYTEDGSKKAPGEPLPGMCIGDGCPASDVMAYAMFSFYLWPTEKYYARFTVFLKENTQETVFYVRAGETNRDVMSDNAAVLKIFTDLGNTVFASGLFDSVTGSMGSCAASPQPTQEDGLYKWIEARISAENYSGEYVQFDVPIIATSMNHNAFALYYRAAALVNDSSYLAEPLDESLTPRTEASKRCTANARSTNFTKPSPLSGKLGYDFACSNEGCIKVFYKQKERRGADGFEVIVPESTTDEDDLKATFSVTDFNVPPAYSDETDGFSMRISLEKFTAASAARYDSSNWIFERTLFGPYLNDEVALAPVPGFSDATEHVLLALEGLSMSSAIRLSYPKNTPPGSTYWLRYDQTAGKLNLYKQTDPDTKLDSIDMRVSPILPADAVYLFVDSNTLPTECSTGSALTRFSYYEDRRADGCFAYDQRTGLLTYDASKSTCRTYQKDPNRVITVNANVTVWPCGEIMAQKTITLNVSTDRTYSALYLLELLMLQFGISYSGPDLVPMFVVNNRQYGKIDETFIEYKDKKTNAFLFKELSDSLLNAPGAKAFVGYNYFLTSEAFSDIWLSNSLGRTSASELSYGDRRRPDSAQEAMDLLGETLYWRRPLGDERLAYGEGSDALKKLDGFPYSAFKQEPPTVYWLSRKDIEGGYVHTNECEAGQWGQESDYIKLYSIKPVENRWVINLVPGEVEINSQVLTATPDDYITGTSQCTMQPSGVKLCGDAFFSFNNCLFPAIGRPVLSIQCLDSQDNPTQMISCPTRTPESNALQIRLKASDIHVIPENEGCFRSTIDATHFLCGAVHGTETTEVLDCSVQSMQVTSCGVSIAHDIFPVRYDPRLQPCEIVWYTNAYGTDSYRMNENCTLVKPEMDIS